MRMKRTQRGTVDDGHTGSERGTSCHLSRGDVSFIYSFRLGKEGNKLLFFVVFFPRKKKEERNLKCRLDTHNTVWPRTVGVSLSLQRPLFYTHIFAYSSCLVMCTCHPPHPFPANVLTFCLCTSGRASSSYDKTSRRWLHWKKNRWLTKYNKKLSDDHHHDPPLFFSSSSSTWVETTMKRKKIVMQQLYQ